MTFNWERRHWIVFVVLLACQVFGLWTTASRGALAMSRDTMRLALVSLPAWVIGSAFLTTLIVVRLFDVVYPKSFSAKSVLGFIVFWLMCIVGGVLPWRLIR